MVKNERKLARPSQFAAMISRQRNTFRRQKMKQLVFSVRVLVLFVFTFGLASLAHGQATRTWVSGVGDDVNPCSRTAPCKTFAGAISKTAEGGEIDALDPGGYGAVTITKAITLDGGTGAGWASILTQVGSGVIVNVVSGTHANDGVVILRHISFQGASQSNNAGAQGINFIKADRLIVENCVFENFSTAGITESSLASSGNMWVEDCFFDNTNTGMILNTSSGFAVTQIDHCRFNGLTDGVNTTASAFVTVRDCYFGQTTGGTNGAIRAAAGCQISVENTVFNNNTIAVNLAGGTIRLSNNSFYGNGTAINGGTAESANNNRFRGNGTDGATTNVITVK
jgi:hypothetical protein